MKQIERACMKEYSNMKVGGRAKALLIPEKKEEMKSIFDRYAPVYILGGGNNVLLNDGDLDYYFVSTECLNKIENLGEGRVRAEAGVNWKDFFAFLEEADLSGVEKMAGIPGSIGGLSYMNGGAFGTEIFDWIEEVEVLDHEGEIRSIAKKDLEVAYRTTEMKQKHWIILSVTFHLKKGYDKATVEDILSQREAKHPLDKPSLGSTFKNPEGDFAARLISEAGLKGRIIGGAQIAEKHPNFVLNLGTASFQDILDILDLVKTSVFEKFGVQLEEEIIIIR